MVVRTQGWWVRRVVKPAVFVLALWPLAWLVRGALAGDLGANPIEKITHWTGFTALTFVLLALCVTPLKVFLGLPALVHLRRMLGLYGFFYALLHFGVYWVDQTVFAGVGFSPRLVAEDVLERPYITVGFTAFLMLVPLAATSADRMVKRLGARRWRALHRLVYFAAAGGVLHYLWKGKMEEDWAVAYGLLLVGLLSWRLVAGRLRERARAVPARGVMGVVPAHPSPLEVGD
ncbi:MAG: protein-methionine-sulfoxide reductase heme-binding subunit MsrQ [Gemmatimonadales bacterium]|nr:Protein-methionine-sulfoxide reductase heme-binding subunit MsrQ [bacterium HR33]GIW51538.1 MAG: protein-methionine-sulfoxide reductase heme-binding subunit MsrQ [Gemmatimonadales bacterium]